MQPVTAGSDTGAAVASAAANSEEIDLDDVEIELEDSGDDDRDQDVDGAAAAEESMFAPVEIHNFDPTGSAGAQRDGSSDAIPEALANILRQQ